jgi:hypothetical protein
VTGQVQQDIVRQDERVTISLGRHPLGVVVERTENDPGENVLQLSHQFTISRGIVGHLARWTLSKTIRLGIGTKYHFLTGF